MPGHVVLSALLMFTRLIQQCTPSNPHILIILYVKIFLIFCKYHLCSTFQTYINSANQEMPVFYKYGLW